MKEIESKSANEILNESYVEISKYVARTRAYTSMIDGFKAVHRRMLYASRNIKGKTKAMEFIAATLVYHPHGDSSVADALVTLTCEYNPLPLFKGYGNFGGVGFEAAAPRYLSAELNDIARLMYLELVDYADYIEGDAGEMEPTYLPSLIPYSLIAGSKGMTVGLPTPNIPSFNLMELIKYFRGALKGEFIEYPKIDVGKAWIYGKSPKDILDLYETGNCKVEYKSIIEYDDPIIKIDSFPPNTKMWGMTDYLKFYIDQRSIEYFDMTSKDGIMYQYELANPDEISMPKLVNKLEDRSWSVDNFRMYFEKDSNVYLCSFNQIVNECLKYLKKCAVRKFEHDIESLEIRMRVIQALAQFKSKYSKETFDQIKSRPASYYKQEMIEWGYSSEVANQAWSKSMTYITSDHDSELPDMEKELKYLKSMQRDPTEYLIGLYDKLESLVKDFYNSRVHSEWYFPQNDESELGFRVTNDHKIEIGSLKKGFISYNKYIYAITKTGIVYKLEVPKVLGSKYSIDPEIVDSIGDSDDLKYLVLRAGARHIIAFPISRFNEEYNDVVRPVAHEEFCNLFGISTDQVILTGEDFAYIHKIEELMRDSTKKLTPLYWGPGKFIKNVKNHKERKPN